VGVLVDKLLVILVVGGLFYLFRHLWVELPLRQEKWTEDAIDALLRWEREQNLPPADLNTATSPNPPASLMAPNVIWTFLTFLNFYMLQKEDVRGITATGLRNTMTEDEFIVLFMRVNRFSHWKQTNDTVPGSSQNWQGPIMMVGELAKREGIAPAAISDFIDRITGPTYKEKMVFYNRLANFTRAHIPDWGDTEKMDETRAEKNLARRFTDTPDPS